MSIRDLTILGCSAQQPTRRRNHGAYLLRWNNEGFLFDPGEGTQRQFIFAEIAPPTVNRIFISHFHGDHCLGLGSMLMRLNLDKVTHPIHCYYPASGKAYFNRLRFGTIYQENIEVIEHPVKEEGLVHEDENFMIEAAYLDHRVDNLGWRIREKDKRRYDKAKLSVLKIQGMQMRELIEKGSLLIDDKKIMLDDVSYMEKGLVFSVVIDTLYCDNAVKIAKNCDLLLCESTFLDEHHHLAEKYHHLTAKEAAQIAKEADAKYLILTHYSARYSDLEPFKEEAAQIFPNVDVADDFKRFPFPVV